MARETFEDQAQAVRRALTGTKLDKADRKHLECAARNLEAFGAFRSKLMGIAKDGAVEDDIDGVAEEIIKLLHMPVPGS